MDLTPYIQSLRDDLLTAASVGDEDVRRAAAVLSAALEPAARLSIMSALSDLAAEVTGALRDTTVDLRLDGRDVRLTVTRHDTDAHTDTRTIQDARRGESWPGPSSDQSSESDDLRRAMQDAGGELSRTTVRLFNELKGQAERAAADQGVSLNTYISRAVADSVRSAVPGKAQHRGQGAGGHTISGYVRG